MHFISETANFKFYKTFKFLLFSLFLFVTASAWASSETNKLQECLNMQGSVPPDTSLECYNQVKQEQLGKIDEKKQFKSLVTVQNRGLADEWTPPDSPFSVYKQNYILFFSYSSKPNNAPSSTNTESQVPISYPLDNRDVKFQISLKAHLLGVQRHALWLGYTQLSFWQIFDTKHSSPFRESNYEPEVIYSYRPENPLLGPLLTTSFLNAGFVHQSNGQALPRSRGWTRIYVQAGFERNFGDNGRLAFLPRLWRRLEWGGTQDIAHTLGHGDMELRYCYGQGVYSAIVMLHSFQFDFAIPMPKIFGVQLLNTNLHFQYFDGYGESLIDYNQSHRTYGFGISVPIE